MADDPALIWQEDPRPRRPTSPAPDAETGPATAPDPPIPGGRVSLREASHQFGVPASTLASWARDAKVDAVKDVGRWMVTPASVAARLSEHHGGKPRKRATPRQSAAGGPAADGTTMLVPRDAWDKLLDQLGNLHEAGQMLADARERAAKAETEVTFLRERLSEIRGERDDLKPKPGVSGAGTSRPVRLWVRLLDALRPEAPRS